MSSYGAVQLDNFVCRLLCVPMLTRFANHLTAHIDHLGLKLKSLGHTFDIPDNIPIMEVGLNK